MYTVQLIDDETQDIQVSSFTKEELNLKNYVYVKYGQVRSLLKIRVNDEVPDEMIYLPKKIGLYTLPYHLPYEIKIVKNELMIGPLIGYMAFKNENEITLKKLGKFTKRVQHVYGNLNGVLFICASDSINTESQSISGYYYNPKGSPKWVYEVFPYPGALYKRRDLKREVLHHLKQHVGEGLFNIHSFSKWKLWETVSTYPDVVKHFPETKQFSSFTQLSKFLKKHQKVYIKPKVGSEGRGIIVLRKKGNQYTLVNTNKGKLQTQHFEDVKNYLLTRDIKKYIVQQAITSPSPLHHADFRLYIQKNRQKEWVLQAAVTRVARKKNIATNSRFVQNLYTGKEGLMKLFSINEDEAKEMLTKMAAICFQVGDILNKDVGHFGDLAFDMMADHHKNIWILEVNHRKFGMKSLNKLNEYDSLMRLQTTPFEYAKTLTGF